MATTTVQNDTVQAKGIPLRPYKHGRCEICALLEYYAASRVNCLPTFRDNVSVPLASFLSYSDSLPVKMGSIRCPETSVNSCHTTPRNIPEERRSHQHRGGSLKSRTVGVV
jgi:hypothetical protein